MGLDYTVKGADGTETVMDSDYVADQLRAQGENVTGVSSDGRTLTIVDAQGELQVPLDQALGSFGWQVQQAMPNNANYEMADPEFRTAISLLPDDNSKRMFLENAMRGRGITNPEISGQGRDWFVYDPESHNYYGVTNNPEWDRTDISEGLASLPGLIGQAGGFMVGGIPGAAAGGTLGRGLARGAVSAADERFGSGEFGKALTSDPSALARTMGMEAGLDAAAAGVAPLAGKMIGPAAEKLANTGLVSSAAKGAGSLAEHGGRLASKGANFIKGSPLGTELASFAIPGAGDAVAYGTLAQLPGMAARGSASLAQKAGRSGVMQKYAPRLGKQLSGIGDDALGQSRIPTNLSNRLTQQAEEMAAALGRRSYTPNAASSTETMLGNLGSSIGRRLGGKQITRAAYDRVRQMGIPADQALKIARMIPEEGIERLAGSASTPGNLLKSLNRPKQYGELGAKLGRGLQTLENLGTGVSGLGTGTTKAVLSTVGRGGQAASRAGLGTKLAGTVASPLENRMYFRYGAEEALNPYVKRSPWQNAQSRDKMYMAQAN